MRYTTEVIESWLSQLHDHTDKLTKWERDFLESVQDQFDRVGRLSDRQIEILERIYADRTT